MAENRQDQSCKIKDPVGFERDTGKGSAFCQGDVGKAVEKPQGRIGGECDEPSHQENGIQRDSRLLQTDSRRDIGCH